MSRRRGWKTRKRLNDGISVRHKLSLDLEFKGECPGLSEPVRRWGGGGVYIRYKV